MTSLSSAAVRGWQSVRLRLPMLFCAAAALAAAAPLSAAPPVRTPPELRVQAPSGAPPKVQPEAARQIAVLQSIKAGKNLAQKKIDSRLLLGVLNARGDQRTRELPDFRFVRPDADGRIEVDILLAKAAGLKPLLEALERERGIVTWRSGARDRVLARVPMAAVEPLAALPDVRRVRLPIPAATHRAQAPVRAKAVNRSEGVLTHAVDVARQTYGAQGNGVKICVLSDGVDSLAALQASDDLPAVDVLPGQAGAGDEGSAMLEIVHDMAPQAELGFATALPTQTQFAQNILDLAADGCDIIVDDIIYFAESPFQDQVIAQAVNTVTAAGVLYFSSAGNEGNKDAGTSGTWEGDFVPNGTPAALAGAGPVHDFGGGSQSILVEAGNTQTPAVLIWAEHYIDTLGTASTDFDLYDLNGALTTVFDASTDTQDGAGGDDFPIEFIGGGAFPGERLVVAKFADGATSSDPMFNLILFRGELQDALTTGGTTRGHSAAAEAYSVAATPVAASLDGVSGDGPFPGRFTTADTLEGFSADGPRRIVLAPDGSELTPGNRTANGGVVRQKPDITAADGVSTAAPGFATFYGTSAAAPHAAAIAGLLQGAVPTATPAQIRSALLSTALDIEAPGVDRSAGGGIVMADLALAALGAEPVATLDAVAWNAAQIAGDGDASIEPNEDWSLAVPLENIGGAAATDIAATLASSTPGVTITQAVATYPDLAAAESAAGSAPYAFFVDDTVACGSVLEFTLTVTHAGDDAQPVLTHAIQSGAPGTPVTFSATDLVAIPDGTDASGAAPGAPAESVLAASGIGRVYAASMRIDGSACSAAVGSTTVGLDHSFVNDLEISLVPPSGASLLAIDNTDGSGNNFCQTALDDGAAASIQGVVSTQAPFTGSFRPATPFSTLAGAAGDGNWTLRAQDFFQQDTGNIRGWSVTLTPAICDAPPQTVALAAEKTVAGSYVEGGTVTYTLVVENTGTGLQLDNPGDELVDTLPAGLVATSATASQGSATLAGNALSWNGALAPGASVTITVDATIAAGTGGSSIANQATVNVDTDRDGSNDTAIVSDDPATPASGDPTSFLVLQGELQLAPAAIDFGDVGVGDSAAAQAVTVTNVGDADLLVSGIVPPAAPFAVSAGTCPPTPFVLTPTDNCTIAFTVTPSATGPVSAGVEVIANGPGANDIALSANGVQGLLAIAPGAVAFGNVAVGDTSAPAFVTLSNTGTDALDVTALAVPAAPFARDGGTCPAAVPFTLGAGESCTLGYTFAPSAPGPAGATLAVAADAPGSGDIALSGTGTQGTLVVTSASIDFGDIAVGDDSTVLATTLRNDGDAALQVTTLEAPTAPFERAGGDCPAAPFPLAAGAECTAAYRFVPTATGAASDVLAVVDDTGGNSSITLLGNGTQAQLAVSPAALAFGDVAVDATSAAQAFTVANPGTADLAVAGIDGIVAPFARSGGTCAAGAFTLAPGGSCTVFVTFSPTATGAAAATVTVSAADAAIADAEVQLGGNGTQLSASLSSGELDLGDIPVGETGPMYEQGIGLANDGTEPVQVTGFGTVDAPFYYAGSTCPALPFTLLPGGSCIVGYGMTPTEPGTFTQTVTFSTSAGELSFELSGTGTAGGTVLPAVPQPAVIPSLSGLGLLLMIALMGLLGVVGVRRQS